MKTNSSMKAKVKYIYNLLFLNPPLTRTQCLSSQINSNLSLYKYNSNTASKQSINPSNIASSTELTVDINKF